MSDLTPAEAAGWQIIDSVEDDDVKQRLLEMIQQGQKP